MGEKFESDVEVNSWVFILENYKISSNFLPWNIASSPHNQLQFQFPSPLNIIACQYTQIHQNSA